MKIKATLQLIMLSVLFEKFAWSSKRPPNIIFIFADDLGWNDVSFHGSTQIPTVNIDALAHTGIILNNYYVQPLCTPSRGCLLTGKYAIRLGLQHYVIGAGEPWGLPPEETVLPQRLQQLGYVTHGVGKWHLGFFRNDYIPTSRGFETFFGYWSGKDDYYTHFSLFGNQTGLDFHDNEKPAWNYRGKYSTEVYTKRVKNIIKHHDQSKPLFLYFAQQAVHTGNSDDPLQSPKYYTKFFKYIKDKDRRIFAGMDLALDKSVSEVFSALDKANMLENSIIVFSSDNGGAVQGIDGGTGSNWPLRGSKYTVWEGGVRGNAFIWSLLFGANKGTVSNKLMHVSDWMPTLYAAAGGDVSKLGDIDGFNLWPTFLHNANTERDVILHNIDPVWEVEGIRKGQYKLVKGSVYNGSFDGWFDKEGKRENKTEKEYEDEKLDPEDYKKLLKKSKVLQILSSRKYSGYFNHLESNLKDQYCTSSNSGINDCADNSPMKNFVRNAVLKYASPIHVQCGKRPANASTNCQPSKAYCLYDVIKDPCEYYNLADRMPKVVKELKDLLDNYRKEMVPVRNKPADPNANPIYHNNTWVSWIKETE